MSKKLWTKNAYDFLISEVESRPLVKRVRGEPTPEKKIDVIQALSSIEQELSKTLTGEPA